MAKSSPARLLRKRESSRQASALELFFDLTFIFALTRLSGRLLHDLSWLNVVQTMVLLGAVWWVWVATAWSTDWFNPNEALIQRLVVGVMLVGLVMAASVTLAFGAHGIFFAGAYVLVHLGRAATLLPALRGHPAQRRTLVVAVWFGVSAAPWLVGAFLPGGPRLALWIVALGIDFTIAYVGWPVPKVGQVPSEQLRVVGEHLAERFGQISIVALGELILVSGTTYASGPFELPQSAAAVLAFANAVALWRLYFLPEHRALSNSLENHGAQIAVIAAYRHLSFVAGIVCIAVGDEITIGLSTEGTERRWGAGLIAVGAVLVLCGRIAFKATSGIWSLGSLLGVVVLLALTPLLLRLPPMVALATTTLVLGAVAFAPSTIGPGAAKAGGIGLDHT
ncbi:low temperature requirement protein A [Micromonospora lupini]|uniref:low temperature requirement protein A n=1 Tax=Micromonospora lupini TaxID=285679 RepID=UPI002252D123|nr:low temperature requirement protein A [Micromonospora lupini]MCX5069125.1 low temperature requirement protein A [Micromonospora lupini]